MFWKALTVYFILATFEYTFSGIFSLAELFFKQKPIDFTENYNIHIFLIILGPDLATRERYITSRRSWAVELERGYQGDDLICAKKVVLGRFSRCSKNKF